MIVRRNYMQKKSFENTCGECRHFRLHYIKYGRGHYDPLSYGHCIKPRRKKWYTADQGCPYYQPREQPGQ